MRAIVFPVFICLMVRLGRIKSCFAWDREVLDSMNGNTRRAYVGATGRLEDWLGGRRLTDAVLALYIRRLAHAGRSASTAEQTLSALRFHARSHGRRDPSGPRTAVALRHVKRTTPDRGRGQAPAATPDEVHALVNAGTVPAALAGRRRAPGGRIGTESLARGALIALLYMGALRVSEAAALRWEDVTEAPGGRGVHVWVRRSKGNPYGAYSDVRYLTGDLAKALLRWRAASAIEDAGDDNAAHARGPVFGGVTPGTLSRRLARAVDAAGLTRRLTAHSFRVGLAAELTRQGASVQEVMHAGGWKSPAMVAHYSAAVRAEGGAVAKYLQERDASRAMAPRPA